MVAAHSRSIGSEQLAAHSRSIGSEQQQDWILSLFSVYLCLRSKTDEDVKSRRGHDHLFFLRGRHDNLASLGHAAGRPNICLNQTGPVW
jgi:hypothetical protein